MAGSSGMHFGARGVPRAGSSAGRTIARWGLEHLRYRLRGSTDEQTAQVLLARSRSCSAGCPSATSRGWPRSCWRASCRGSIRRCSTRFAPTRTPAAPRSSSARPANELVEMLARVLGMEGGIGTRYEVDGEGVLTGGAWTAVHLRRGQGGGDARVRRRARHRPRRRRGPTRTRPRTCRCCARSATRSRSTRTPSWRRIGHSRRAGG